MRRIRMRPWWVSCMIILLIFGLAGCSLFEGSAVVEQTEPDPIAVLVHTVEPKDLTDYMRFSGRVMGAGEIPVVPMTTGFVKEVRVQVGDRVKKEQVLFVLDDKMINEQIKKLQDTSAGLRNRLAEIEREVERSLEVPVDGPLPDDPLDRLANITRLMSEMQTISGQLGQVESAIAQAKAQKDNMTIKAPAAGKVAMVMAVNGGVAATGNPVAVLVDISRMYVDINVFENQIGMIQKKQIAQIVVPAYSEYPLSGEVAIISPILNAQTRGYTVRILLNGTETGGSSGGLFIGMFARVEIPLRIYEQVLAVPREAVLDRYEGKFVFIVKEDRAELRQVETGYNTNDYIEVTQGLTAGEWVVVSGQHYLESGDPVDVRGWGEER